MKKALHKNWHNYWSYWY